MTDPQALPKTLKVDIRKFEHCAENLATARYSYVISKNAGQKVMIDEVPHKARIRNLSKKMS